MSVPFSTVAGVSFLYRVWAYLYQEYSDRQTGLPQDIADAINIIKRLRFDLINERNTIQAS